MFDSDPISENKSASADPLLLSDAVSFRNDKKNEKPASSINIVMSMGGIGFLSDKQVRLDHNEGVRNLVTAALPFVQPPKVSTGSTISVYDKTMSKNNNHCDSTNGLQRRLTEGQITNDVNASLTVDNSSESTLPDVSVHKLAIEPNSTAADESNKDFFPSEKSPAHAATSVKSSVDILSMDETPSEKLNLNEQTEKESNLTNVSDFAKPGSSCSDVTAEDSVQVDSIQYSSVVALKTSDETIKDSSSTVTKTDFDLKVNTTLQYSSMDSTTEHDTEAPGETPVDNLATDETEHHSSLPETTATLVSHTLPPLQRKRSSCVSSSDSQIADEVLPSLLRPRTRSSSRHRLVQILSASDLEFGPFLSYEEKNTEESEETGEQLKRKASRLKLIDSGDAKRNEQDDFSIEIEKLPENLTAQNSCSGDSVFGKSISNSNIE